MRFEVATESARQGDHRRGDRVAFACKPHSVIIVIWLESALSAAFCAGPEHVCFRTHTRIPKIEFIASFGGAHRYLAAFLPTRIFFSFFFLLFSGCSFRPSRHNYAVRGGSRGAWRTRIASSRRGAVVSARKTPRATAAKVGGASGETKSRSRCVRVRSYSH